MEPSDSFLLAAARTGDPDAFDRFYRRHRERILAYLARRTTREAAADLMSETFATALEVVRDGQRELPETPIAWLFTVSHNLLVDSRRRGRVEASARARLGLEPLVLEDQDLVRVAEIAEATDILEGLADELTEAQWTALNARVLAEEPYPVIAMRLRCSEAVVRKRVSRALTALRTTLGDTHA